MCAAVPMLIAVQSSLPIPAYYLYNLKHQCKYWSAQFVELSLRSEYKAEIMGNIIYKKLNHQQFCFKPCNKIDVQISLAIVSPSFLQFETGRAIPMTSSLDYKTNVGKFKEALMVTFLQWLAVAEHFMVSDFFRRHTYNSEPSKKSCN